MRKLNSILGILLLAVGFTSCQKEADFAYNQTGVQPCLKWSVDYPSKYSNIHTFVNNQGMTIDAELLGKYNAGDEVQYIIQPVDENGELAYFEGDFTAELSYSDFVSTPAGGCFELVIGGYTGTPLTYDGIYGGSVGSNSNNEGFGLYTTNSKGIKPVNIYNNSNKFLQSKQTNGSFFIQRKGSELIITIRSDYSSLSDTQVIYDDKLNMNLQLSTNADDDVQTSITLNNFKVVGGGGKIRSDFFDCYSIKLN